MFLINPFWFTATATMSGLTELYSTTLASPAASIDTGTMTTSGTHLLVFLFGRSAASVTDDAVLVAVNNDSTNANYWRQYFSSLNGNTNTGSEGEDRIIGELTGATSPTNSPGVLQIDIPFYLNTTFHKLLKNHGGMRHQSGAGEIALATVEWENTAAINRLVFTLLSGSNFVAGTRLQVLAY